MLCFKNHFDADNLMLHIPVDQGGTGRHKCASCAYEQGFEDGFQRKQQIDLAVLLDSLPESQRAARRHKSPHAAYAFGYLNGITRRYAEQ